MKNNFKNFNKIEYICLRSMIDLIHKLQTKLLTSICLLLIKKKIKLIKSLNKLKIKFFKFLTIKENIILIKKLIIPIQFYKFLEENMRTKLIEF